MDSFHLIAYFTISTVLLPLSLAIIQWKRISPDIAALRWLLIASLTFDIVMGIMGTLGMRNLELGDVFMFIQFAILLYIFSRQFTHKILFVMAGLIVGLFYVAGLLVGNPDVIPNPTTFIIRLKALSGSSAIDGLVLITVVIAFFYKLLNGVKIANIHRLPVLWVAFATLFYYSGNLFIFLASGYLEEYPDTLILFWNMHNVLNVLKNILFAIALWHSYRIVKN